MTYRRAKLIGLFACLLGLIVAAASLAAWFKPEPTAQLLDASGQSLTAGTSEYSEKTALNESPFAAALALIKRRQFAEAKRELQQVIQRSEEDGQACIHLCDVHRELRDLPAALDYGRKAVELMPDSAAAHLAYAKAVGAQLGSDAKSLTGMLSAMKGLGMFKDRLDRVIELNPEDTEARATLVFTNLAPRPWGNIQRAFQLCDEIQMHDAPLGIQLRAVCYQANKEHDQAIEILRAGIQQYQTDRTFRVTLGDIYFEQKKTEAADAEYDIARSGEKDQSYYRALYGKARLRIENKVELEQAVELLGEFIAASPDSEGLITAANALWRKGMALELLGQKSQARQAYEESLRRDPGLDQAQAALAELKD